MDQDVWQLVRQSFETRSIDIHLPETLIVHIPKVDHPKHLRNFRPISLCNIIYKIITKFLEIRLCQCLHDLVGPLQESFILRRATLDNSVVAQEPFQSIKGLK